MKVNIVMMIEPGRLEWQSIILILSLKRFCMDEYKIHAYCRSSLIQNLNSETINFLRRHNIEILGIENNYYPEYPHGNKIIACSQEREGGDISVFMDSDTFLYENVSFEEIGDIESVSVVAAEMKTWGDDTSWKKVYEKFKLDPPKKHYMLNNGELFYPYFNAGLIIFPEKSVFKHRWLEISEEIDRDEEIQNKRPWLDQIALPLAINKSELELINLHNMYNYKVNNDSNIPKAKIIHYHGLNWIWKHNLNIFINNNILKEEYGSLFNLLQKFKEDDKITINVSKKIPLTIHFGIHRTGTTNLQDYLKNNNKKILENYGILYPELNIGHNHGKLAWGMLSKKISHRRLPELIYKEYKDLSKKINRIVLSSEDFALLDSDWLKELNKYFDIDGVIYLRRQDLWLESWYNQHIRWPWDRKISSMEPDEFLKIMDQFYWIDYDNILNKITDVIPKEKIRIGIMQNNKISNTTLDFLNYLEIDVNKLNKTDRKNESVSYLQLQILKEVGMFELDSNQRKKVIDAVKKLKIDEDNGLNIIFDAEQRNYIIGKYRESNKKVAREYFDSDDLFDYDFDHALKPNIISKDIIYKKYIPKLIKEVL